MTWSRKRIARTTGLIATFVYGWWLIGSFRTTSVGNDQFVTCLLIALLYVLPISFLPLLGLEARKVFTYSLLVVAFALVGALAWANIEEFVMIQSTTAQQPQQIERWWPFNHTVIISGSARPDAAGPAAQ